MKTTKIKSANLYKLADQNEFSFGLMLHREG